MASEATQNSYEQQREERIAQNRKKLADMGIVEAWKEAAQLRVPTKANIVKVKREAPVTRSHGLIRKSARLHPGLKREYEATVEEEKLSKRCFASHGSVDILKMTISIENHFCNHYAAYDSEYFCSV
jgi:hypothetical protein